MDGARAMGLRHAPDGRRPSGHGRASVHGRMAVRAARAAAKCPYIAPGRKAASTQTRTELAEAVPT